MEVPVQKPSTFKLKARLPIPLFGICDGKHILIISFFFFNITKENQQKYHNILMGLSAEWEWGMGTGRLGWSPLQKKLHEGLLKTTLP